MKKLVLSCDIAVVGGGMAGICAAIASARMGAKTVLLHDRPVLGGNASSEVRMHIVGASRHGNRKNLRETGIIEEILLENKFRNAEHSYAIFDTVLWEKVKHQENLDLYLNTYINEVKTEKKKIISVSGMQTTSEKHITIYAKSFIDCSGDGLISHLAEADFMFGREGKEIFREKNAIDKSDNITMGNSIQFRSLKADRAVPFVRPCWAYDFSESEWIKNETWEEITSGYFWLELGGTELDCLSDAEDTRDELLKIVYGVWDYIKNHSPKRAEVENYYLDWIGFIPAKREGRRFIGDYVLNENDLLANQNFDDAVAYGGWHIDDHAPESFKRRYENIPYPTAENINFEGIYSIPYRCLYSKDLDNLYLGGRLISVSHRAFSSTRVMGTCAVAGEAVGIAASLAVRDNLSARENLKNTKEIQQLLLKSGCYIPEIKNDDPNDLALKAKTISDFGEPQNIINGVSRPVDSKSNMWTAPIAQAPDISLIWEGVQKIKEIIITLDSNLSVEIMPSLSRWHHVRQSYSVPDTLLRDFTIEAFLKGELIFKKEVCDNYQRIVKIGTDIFCDSIKITPKVTRGDSYARICEIRVY